MLAFVTFLFFAFFFYWLYVCIKYTNKCIYRNSKTSKKIAKIYIYNKDKVLK